VEVAAAKLAATKATNPAVKAFAARMAADHAKANSELEKVATGQSLKMPDTTAAVSRAMAKLQNLSGAEFDKEYMEMQVRAHQDAVTLFEHQSQRGTDASIKAFAQQTLPTLREHQKMAHDAADAAGVKGK
jgi:putative membrane protein